MKTVLLSATLLTGCLLFTPAWGQIATIDNSNLIQNIKTYVQDLKSYATQLSQLQQEVQTAETTYQMLNSFVQNPNLGTAMGLMNAAGLGSALPINPYSVQSLVNGAGGLNGTLGSLSGLLNSSFNTNTVFTCTNQSWACQQQQQNAIGLAGAQGIGMQEIQTLTTHLGILQALRLQLETAQTPAQRENAMAALQTENAWAVEEGNRLMAANVLIESERDVRAQQDNEKLQKDLQATITRYGG